MYKASRLSDEPAPRHQVHRCPCSKGPPDRAPPPKGQADITDGCLHLRLELSLVFLYLFDCLLGPCLHKSSTNTTQTPQTSQQENTPTRKPPLNLAPPRHAPALHALQDLPPQDPERPPRPPAAHSAHEADKATQRAKAAKHKAPHYSYHVRKEHNAVLSCTQPCIEMQRLQTSL